ncbi:MAG: DUF3325 domain-containing protein [Parvibaculaceae bacterium]|nr:DUF3325 domain-containing protein [Parvibaculaceae bacterium]
MLMFLSLSLSYAGFAALAFSMQRHHRQLRSRAPTRGQALGLKMAGWSALAASFVVSILAWGSVIGPVAGFGVLSGGALGFTLLLAFRPRVAAALTLAAPLCLALSLLS